jgi:hypothetical protein
MKSVTDNINKSLAKLAGGNSSDLLDNYNSLYKMIKAKRACWPVASRALQSLTFLKGE